MKGDYTKYSFVITAIVLVLMLCVSFIPPFEAFGIKFKRTNIFSEIFQFDDPKDSEQDAEIAASDLSFIAEMDATAGVGELPTSEGYEQERVTTTWDLGLTTTPSGGVGDEEPAQREVTDETFAGVVKIEDFSDGSRPSIADFCNLLGSATQRRVVRLGFMGDSYIEGDIITADVREQLQGLYGGSGVGFVPFSTPLAQNRPTIKHTSGGWKNYNLIQKASAPESVKEMFYISGVVSQANKGAWSAYEMTTFRKHISHATSARLIFKNTVGSEIKMVVNDTIERTFTPDILTQVQQLHVAGGGMKSVKVTIENHEGFYGYGVVFEGKRGISVDNYSIRSNSGLAIFGTNGALNREINKMLGYDMIVLQYGLNIMQADVTSYKSYGEQLRNIINYIKSCFPRAVIVVFGVGDRSTLKDGEFVTMPAVKGMIAEQKAAAKECGVAFWSIYDAMGGYNSMSRFVEWGWAAKDYTHLSFGGGRRIATQFVKALEYAKAYPDGGGTENADYRDVIVQPAVRLDSFEDITDSLDMEIPAQESIGDIAPAPEQDSIAREAVVEEQPETETEVNEDAEPEKEDEQEEGDA